MGIPLKQSLMVGWYVVKNRLQGRKRFPLVLMLEPLFRCNLECAGCGKVQYPPEVLRRNLSPEECWEASEECAAPVVSIAGGEPLLHLEIDRIVAGLVERKRFVYLCTNGLLLEKHLPRFRPSDYLTFSVHVDGTEAQHDRMVCREGVFRAAVSAIRASKTAGFRVTTNTTIFEGENPEDIREMFDELAKLGVDGMMISPGYSYSKAPDQEHFLHRERTRALFRRILARPRKTWQFNHSPLFLDFLRGKIEYECTPWGNPTRNVFGWQKPCYLLGDGYARSFRQLLEETRWANYGHRSGNPKCADCMVHSGYEASAVMDGTDGLSGGLRMARAFRAKN
ncbi:MAG: adenosyl-hopene transferase HpnH [Planctomycetes bacterium]|nr:adenosyl-hopene transferase HpnH [Planctomycetota bacterium]